ncbi:MAG: hypothetical protein EPN26_13755 [Rhodospirillales bacterium]|nr:MAG: hypothetical protein EPN26_13755 [Rhodospirillales bacterium]
MTENAPTEAFDPPEGAVVTTRHFRRRELPEMLAKMVGDGDPDTLFRVKFWPVDDDGHPLV